MDRHFEAYTNLASMLCSLGKLPGTEYFGCEPGIALYDSGVTDAYENYALLEPEYPADEETIERGLNFFKRRGRAHIWPIFPGVADEARGILEDHGLARDGDFHIMTAETSDVDLNDVHPCIVETISGDDEAGEWADCVWRGFDSDDGPPASFVSNVCRMARMDAFTLVRVGLKATGMLYSSCAACGIYYVATRREFRGEGLAGAIVEKLKVLAYRMGFKRVVLLATASGLRLYLKHGFTDVGTVKIYRKDHRSEVL